MQKLRNAALIEMTPDIYPIVNSLLRKHQDITMTLPFYFSEFKKIIVTREKKCKR
jgi:hypothetical protein